MVPLPLATARCRLSGAKVRALTGPGELYPPSFLPVARSHHATRPPRSNPATVSPSGDATSPPTATWNTFPSSARGESGFSGSHTCTKPSAPPVTSPPPSGVTASATIICPWMMGVGDQSSLVRFQRITFWFLALLVNKVKPSGAITTASTLSAGSRPGLSRGAAGSYTLTTASRRATSSSPDGTTAALRPGRLSSASRAFSYFNPLSVQVHQ